jgi:transposase
VLDEAVIEARLFKVSEANSPRKRHVQPDWKEIHLELRKPGVTLELLWQEYRNDHPEGLGRTQFSDYYREYRKKVSVVMRQSYPGGKWGFVDFSGNKIPIIDSVTNEVWWAELFVAALGASSYTFACATVSQNLTCWLQAHVEMYEYFKGSPALTVVDNLKSGVSRPCRYDPEANRSYQDLAEHYGTCVYPTRVYRPRDKAKAEAAVLVAQRWIIAALRNRRFYSLAEVNAAIRNECLERINTRTMRHFGKSRRELWECYDRPNLKSLPPTRYEFSTWKRVTLNIDYHIAFEGHYYSAPNLLVRQELWVRATHQAVEIFHKGKRVASHLRSFIPHKATTDSAHMPEEHRRHAEWSPSRILQWAGKSGPHCQDLVQKILESKKHPELGYRSALGVIRLGNRFGADRLEKACLKALSIESPVYRTVQSILKYRTEEKSEETATLPISPENIRGPTYYH